MSLSKILTKLGLREIKNNWKQLLAITTIGAIAVTLFVGLMANAENFSDRVETTFNNGNMADIWVTTSSHDKKDEAKIKEIVGDNGNVESRFEITGQAGSHSIYAVIENGEPTISKPYDLTKGEKDTDTYFVRIDEAISNKYNPNGYKIGDPFDVTIDMSSFGKMSSLLSDLLHLEDSHTSRELARLYVYHFLYFLVRKHFLLLAHAARRARTADPAGDVHDRPSRRRRTVCTRLY